MPRRWQFSRCDNSARAQAGGLLDEPSALSFIRHISVLTSPPVPPPITHKLSTPQNMYAAWRTRMVKSFPLREDATGAPPERLLQAVWHHQRLRREALVTADGRRVRVLHPGFWNREPGPDFRNAAIQFGDAPPVFGDVEVDLQPAGWHAHAHDRNPAFAKVILHVVWNGTRASAAPAPMLVLEKALDAPLAELNSWLGSETSENFPEALAGRCAAPLKLLKSDRVQELLRQAAAVRREGKAAQMQARAREAGWEQALWEGLFRALGYKHNTWPMQTLAENRVRLTSGADSSEHIEARLLGAGALLPDQLSRAQAETHARRVWDFWWRDRDTFADAALPKALWRLHGVRPANHPQRRLALAARWLHRRDLTTRLEEWFMTDHQARELPASLLAALQVTADDFWSWHWTLRSARLAKAQPLLGEARVTDFAVNIILPWLWMRAVEGRNETLRKRAEAIYEKWPAGEDNAVLALARKRLLSDAAPKRLDSAAAQQGLLQIVRDFCERSNTLCDSCGFPDLVKAFASA